MKTYYCIVDTETTVDDTVADFAAVIVDNRGKVIEQLSCLVLGEFDRKDLFYIPDTKGGWSFEYSQKKRVKYNTMLAFGTRMMCSVGYINNWIMGMVAKYNLVLTAYNLSFDVAKCRNTGIHLDRFYDSFCLWNAAASNICKTKKYRQFVLENHLFNKPTEKGNMTFQTNAEAVFGYINGSMVIEPHTALEDALYFEVPILVQILKIKNWRDNVVHYKYQDFQVRDHFKAK